MIKVIADVSSCVVSDFKGTFIPWPYNIQLEHSIARDAALQSDKSQNVSQPKSGFLVFFSTFSALSNY